MRAIGEFTANARPAGNGGTAVAKRRPWQAGKSPAPSDGAEQSRAAAAPRQKRQTAREPRSQRGTNARYVEEVLQSNAPRALRPVEIRSAIERDKGVAIAFASLRHALEQLATRHAAEQVGTSNTWRYTGAPA